MSATVCYYLLTDNGEYKEIIGKKPYIIFVCLFIYLLDCLSIYLLFFFHTVFLFYIGFALLCLH